MTFPVSNTLLVLALLGVAGCASPRRGRDFTLLSEIPYVPDGGERRRGDLYLPVGDGPWPAAVVLHGGGWIRRDRSDMTDVAKALAASGIAAYNINYRLAPEHQWPAQLDDVHAALRHLAAHAGEHHLDPARFVTVGYSAGGHLALLGAELSAEGVPPVQAVLAGGAPTQLTLYPDSPFINKLIGGPPSEFPDAWTRASPLVHVDAGHPPVFLYHGRFDALVQLKNAKMMRDELQRAGVEVELDIRFPLGHLATHFFDGPSIRRGIHFLKKHLEKPNAGTTK